MVLRNSLHSLACVLRASVPKDALAAFSESLQLAREVDDPNSSVAYCLEDAAPIFAGQGDLPHAASLLGAASTIRALTGDTRTPAERAEADAAESQCRGALAPEAFTAAWEQGAVLDADAAAAWALESWERATQRFPEYCAPATDTSAAMDAPTPPAPTWLGSARDDRQLHHGRRGSEPGTAARVRAAA